MNINLLKISLVIVVLIIVLICVFSVKKLNKIIGGSPGYLSPYSRCEIYWKIINKKYLIIKLGYISSNNSYLINDKEKYKEFASHYNNGLLEKYSKSDNYIDAAKEWNHEVIYHPEPINEITNYKTDFTPGTLASLYEVIGHISILDYISNKLHRPILCISDDNFHSNINIYYQNVLEDNKDNLNDIITTRQIIIRNKKLNKPYYIPVNYNFHQEFPKEYYSFFDSINDSTLCEKSKEEIIKKIIKKLKSHKQDNIINENNINEILDNCITLSKLIYTIQYLSDNNEFYIAEVDNFNEKDLKEFIKYKFITHIKYFEEINKNKNDKYFIGNSNILKPTKEIYPLSLNIFRNSNVVKESYENYDNVKLFDAITNNDIYKGFNS